jgi:precorrin-2 dehydrogenase/sirohydrochlorin ferrochelatase
MVPIALDPKTTKLAVAGNGALALRRLRSLRAAGALDALLFADAPTPELLAEAGDSHRPALPDAGALAAIHVLWIVDVEPARAESLATLARANKVLVNVEDVPPFCDFHSVAEIRRGDLLLTVSTNGAAPGLAGAIRKNLEHCFGAEWSERVAQVAALRREWRAEGIAMPEAARRIADIVETRCWVSCRRPI